MRTILLACLVWLAAGASACAYTTKAGDTPGALAQQFYGDFGYWKALMWYNGLGQNPYTLPIGAQINVPDKGSLDKIKTMLAQNQSPQAISQAIAAMGGTASNMPQAQSNPGRGGAKTFYYARWSLGLQKPAPSR